MKWPRATDRTWNLLGQLAAHFAMGACLGTIGALILMISDAGAIRELLAAHSASAGMPVAVFIGTWAGAIAIGSTLTGCILSIADED